MAGTACPDLNRGPSMKPVLHRTVGSGGVLMNLIWGLVGES